MTYKLYLIIFSIYLQNSIVLSSSNCSKNTCKDGWKPVGRYCIKIHESVAFFNEADNICKKAGSNILSKSSLLDSELRDLINEIHKDFSPSKSHSFWNNGKMYMFGRDLHTIAFMTYDDFRDFSCISTEFCGGKCIGKRKYNNMLFTVHGISYCLSNAPDGKTKYPVICQYVCIFNFS